MANAILNFHCVFLNPSLTISYTNTVKTHKNKRKTDFDIDLTFDWYRCWKFCGNILVLKCCIFCTLKILFSGYFQSKLGSNKVHSWTSLEGKTETKFDNIKGYVLSFLAYNKYSKLSWKKLLIIQVWQKSLFWRSLTRQNRQIVWACEQFLKLSPESILCTHHSHNLQRRHTTETKYQHYEMNEHDDDE